MRPFAVFVLLFFAAGSAQGVMQDAVTTRDLLDLFDDAVAIEVEIPEGATTFHLSYGRGGVSSFLDQNPTQGPPTSLRVVAFLPDPSEVDPCEQGQAQATIVATLISDEGRGERHSQKVCVPHPDKSRITGAPRQVMEGDAPVLGEWTPLLFHAWLVRESQDERGGIDSAIALENSFTIQVMFASGNSTGFESSEVLRLQQFAELPAVRQLIEKYGVVRP